MQANLKHTAMTACAVAWLALHGALAHAQTRIPYQGRLAANGTSVNGIQSMRFEVFPSETDGTALETINQDVTVTGGVFSVLLPVSAATLDVPTLFLQVSVGSPGSLLSPLAGRQRIYPAALAHRASPEATFRANGISTTGLAVGPMVIGPTGLIQAPTMRSAVLVGDGQGIVPGAIRWTDSPTQACTNGRPNCRFVDVPFESNGGTVMMTVESTAWRAASGKGEIFFILDPDAGGAGYNAGSLRMWIAANNHQAFPTQTITFPQWSLACESYPCSHNLRIITRSNANSNADGVAFVDVNDFIRVTLQELPYVTP